MKILIVDDNKEGCLLLDALVKGHGFETDMAENGKIALQKLGDTHFDLIISDILMPVMDGFQLCRAVRMDKTLHRMPIIIYTATYTGIKDEEFAIRVGADRFVQKPCDPEIFIKIIHKVMGLDKSSVAIKKQTPDEDEEVLKLYNQRLVRKLEQKMLRAELEIKKRQDAEEALKESEEKLRRITTSAQDAIVMMDDHGKVDFWNGSAERIFGYSSKEIIGKDLHTLLAPQRFQDLYSRGISQFRTTGEGVFLDKVMELSGRKKDGTEFPIELSLSGVEIRGKWHAIGIVRDISDRKRIEIEQKEIEKKVQQTQRMEAIGTLAGGIAHDFNNLLSAILGFTELSLDEVDKGSILEDNLLEIYAASNRAKELVKQILTVARHKEEGVKPIQIDTIAKEVLKLIRSSIPVTIDIRQKIESDSLIVGNSTQIHQMIMNLCTNAAQAMEDDGGILEVSLNDILIQKAASASVSELVPGEYLELKVSDTGPGIHPNIIESIFEPYFTTKRFGEGTGIGLALVQSIVEGCGGKIYAESTLGKGTVFTIYLPISKKRKSFVVNEPEALPSGTERILFIDDEAQIAKAGSLILKKLGYSVTIRSSSVEALELFRSKFKDIDLVITDMTMPNMSGDKLSVELIKIRPDIPIILCTGYSKKISEESASEIGIKAFAYKPIVKADLAKTVRKVLDEAKNSA